MRYVFAAIFACALGLPAAYAMPAFGPHAPAWAKASPAVQVVKHNKATAHRHSRGNGGIHALVGSGDY
jgi:hypothetical protein